MSGIRNGLVLLDKPRGVTSFGILTPVKAVLGTKKIGHTGTLDKFAEGLLVLLVGGLTKLTPYISDMDKEYVAVFRFGMQTDTLDPEGIVVKKTDVPPLSVVEKRLGEFLGDIRQVPPAYSAVHTGGERAYRLAREGKEVNLAPRNIRVDSIEILGYSLPFLTVRIKCSKGTYIRSLARDIGEACGSSAYVSELKRTRVGPFLLSDAVQPETFTSDNVIPPDEFFLKLDGFSPIRILNGERERLLHGQTLQDASFRDTVERDGMYPVFDEHGKFLALVEREHSRYRYKFVVPA